MMRRAMPSSMSAARQTEVRMTFSPSASDGFSVTRFSVSLTMSRAAFVPPMMSVSSFKPISPSRPLS